MQWGKLGCLSHLMLPWQIKETRSMNQSFTSLNFLFKDHASFPYWEETLCSFRMQTVIKLRRWTGNMGKILHQSFLTWESVFSCLSDFMFVCVCVRLYIHSRHLSTKIHVSCLSVSSTSTSINETSVNSK